MNVKSIVLLATIFVSLQHTVPGQTQLNQQETFSTVNFCELAKHPRRYFNKTVRIEAQWTTGFEFSYLVDDRCPPRPTHDIAVRFVADEAQRETIKKNVDKIMSHEYGGRAMITTVGVLRNPGKYYGYFRYIFEIHRFEEVTHVVVPYERMLDAGKTYRAVVRGDRDSGLALVPPLKIPNTHFATRIEWMNLSEFPALERLRETSGEMRIVFSVISVNTKQMTAERWNQEVQCKIIRLE